MPLHDPRDLDEAIAAHEAGEALRRGELPPYLRRACERRPGANRRGLRGFGGGGGAPAAAWLPSDITGVAEWWRADLGVTDAGAGAVSAWQGQIAGEVLSQGTAAARPTLTTRDSQSVLSFDGGDYVRGTFATLGTLATGYSIVFVAERTAGVYLMDGSAAGMAQVYTSAGNWRIWSGTVLSTATPATGEQALVSKFGASGEVYVDDFSTPVATGNTGTNTLGGVTLGATSGGATNITGFIWEVILVDQAITSGDLALLGAYLDARYAGLSLTY